MGKIFISNKIKRDDDTFIFTGWIDGQYPFMLHTNAPLSSTSFFEIEQYITSVTHTKDHPVPETLLSVTVSQDDSDTSQYKLVQYPEGTDNPLIHHDDLKSYDKSLDYKISQLNDFSMKPLSPSNLLQHRKMRLIYLAGIYIRYNEQIIEFSRKFVEAQQKKCLEQLKKNDQNQKIIEKLALLKEKQDVLTTVDKFGLKIKNLLEKDPPMTLSQLDEVENALLFNKLEVPQNQLRIFYEHITHDKPASWINLLSDIVILSFLIAGPTLLLLGGSGMLGSVCFGAMVVTTVLGNLWAIADLCLIPALCKVTFDDFKNISQKKKDIADRSSQANDSLSFFMLPERGKTIKQEINQVESTLTMV